jgi:hypothetical protein
MDGPQPRRLVTSVLSPEFRGTRNKGILHGGRVILLRPTRTYGSSRAEFIRHLRAPWPEGWGAPVKKILAAQGTRDIGSR